MTQFTQLDTLHFNLSNNKLTGSLPSRFTPDNRPFTGSTFEFHLASNQLSGTLPPTILQGIAQSTIAIDLSNNALTGTIPSNIISSVPVSSSLTFSVAQNRLNGSLTLEASNTRPSTLILSLSNNNFGGTIPSDFLQRHRAGISTIELAGCGFTGELPTLPTSRSYELHLNFDNNSFTSTGDIAGWITGLNDPPYEASISVANNQLAGDFSLPSVSGQSPWLQLNLQNNSLTSLNIVTLASYLQGLVVSHNKNLTGSLPSDLLDAGLEVLAASNTALSGDFPTVLVANSLLLSLDLSNTAINFCGSDRNAWTTSYLSHCVLKNTNATMCMSLYPAVCQERSSQPNAPTNGSSVSIALSLPVVIVVAFLVSLLL